MSSSLPAPSDVVEAASDAVEGTNDGEKGAPVNVVVAGDPTDPVEQRDSGYVGPGAVARGHLAAASETSARVHGPSPTFTAPGPWLVLAPLGSVVATVATGTARVAVETVVGEDVSAVSDRLAAVLDVSRPTHDTYPVDDDAGVFTTGMTTYAFESARHESDRLTVEFAVSTTPATTTEAVRSRFRAVDGVESVTYQPVVPVERAAPSAEVRTAVETVHREVVGDAQYDWLPGPGVFSHVPSAEKVALGTGERGSERFTDEQFTQCVALLGGTIERLEGST